jgi:2-pyrone-4,6-dicarboxylate lactonase
MTRILPTTPMRAAETNTRPRFAMPAGACDAHFHVFEPGFPHVPDPLYTFPDATLEQYLRMTEVLGIERMVLVQPTFYGTDNRLLADVLGRVGPRARGVVRIEDDTSDAELDAYHELGVRAIRLDLFARASWPTGDIIGYVRRMPGPGRAAGTSSSIRPGRSCATCCRSWPTWRTGSSSITWATCWNPTA